MMTNTFGNCLSRGILLCLFAGHFVHMATAQDLWKEGVVRDFHFTFSSTNFWAKLEATATNENEIVADLVVDGITYTNVGIRMRSSSSSLPPGLKKPFNVKLNHVVEGQDLYGFSTLNLNNGAVDPTLTRETIGYRILREYMPAPRTAYIRLHFNEVYWGLYLLVEQPNRDFLEDWFSSNDGTRYKADRPGAAAVNTSRLRWFGPDTNSYITRYEAKTPTHTNAWTDLIDVIDTLNNEPAATFKAEIEQLINVDRALWYFAIMNLIINSDDCMGAGHNYYMYFDEADGRMNLIPWDLNEAFGVHGPSTAPWTYDVLKNAGKANYPLVSKFLGVPEWRELYFAHYRTAMNRWMNWANVIGPLNDQYQDLIRDDVAADTNLLYPAYFDPSFPGRVFLTFHWAHGLKEVVENREAFLRTHADLTKQEPQISNVTPLKESVAPGEAFWVTAVVTGAVAIQTVELRSSVSGVFDATVMHDDGLHNDGAAGDGLYGGFFTAADSFRIMRYYVHASDTSGTVQVSPPEAEHQCYSFRVGRGEPAGPIHINELMADNETTQLNEFGIYPDWFELYNAGTNTVDLSGYTITDNFDIPAKWTVPMGTTLAAGAHLLIWADGNSVTNTLALDTNFKLGKGGDELALFNPKGVLLDAVVFDEMSEDFSLGVWPDGGSTLYDMAVPTPGTTNRR